MKPKDINKLALAGKGFWSRFIPDPVKKTLRKWFLFAPEDPWDMSALPPANVKLPGTKHTAYRTPAPGSASIQSKKLNRTFDPDRIYDNTDYTHMAANLPPALSDTSSEFNMGDLKQPDWVKKVKLDGEGNVLEGSEEGEEVYDVIEGYGSPRRTVNPAVTWYDPEGLRTTFNTSYNAMYKAVLKNTKLTEMPPHWPIPKATRVVMMNPRVKEDWFKMWEERNAKYANCASNPEGTNFHFMPPTMDRAEFHQPFPLNEEGEEEGFGVDPNEQRLNY
jgi:hypothetical protein